MPYHKKPIIAMSLRSTTDAVLYVNDALSVYNLLTEINQHNTIESPVLPIITMDELIAITNNFDLIVRLTPQHPNTIWTTWLDQLMHINLKNLYYIALGDMPSDIVLMINKKLQEKSYTKAFILTGDNYNIDASNRNIAVGERIIHIPVPCAIGDRLSLITAQLLFASFVYDNSTVSRRWILPTPSTKHPGLTYVSNGIHPRTDLKVKNTMGYKIRKRDHSRMTVEK